MHRLNANVVRCLNVKIMRNGPVPVSEIQLMIVLDDFSLQIIAVYAV